MTLAALIIAEDEGFAGQGVATQVTMFGMPLLEVQARQAHVAGANHIVIFTKQVPASLVAAMDRLRASGIDAVLARSAKEAADSIHPEESVLLIAPGCIAERRLIQRLAKAEDNIIVVAPLKAMASSREMIDARHDWAGVARIDGGLVRQTSTMLGDWALGATLVRTAIQAGASLLNAEGEPDGGFQTVISQSDANTAVQLLVARAPVKSGQNFVSKSVSWLGMGLARLAAVGGLQPALTAAVPLALLLCAALLTGASWYRSGLFLFAFLPIFGQASRAIIDASLSTSKMLACYDLAVPWVGRALLIGTSIGMWHVGYGWGSITLAGWLTWLLWEDFGQAGKWRGDEYGSAFLTAAGIVAGYPVIGLGLALGQCILSKMLKLKQIA